MDNSLFDYLRALEEFKCGEPAPDCMIDQYEKVLGVTFPIDFRTFVRAIGFASWASNFILGITNKRAYDLIETHKLAANRNSLPRKGSIILNSDFALDCRSEFGLVYQRYLMPTDEETIGPMSFEKYLQYVVSSVYP